MLETSTIGDVLRHKGAQVFTVDEDATVSTAVQRMIALHVGSLLVLRAGKPVGMFGERDALRRIIYEERDPRCTAVREVMQPNPLAVKASARVADTMRAMTVHRTRHLPVVDNHEVAGVVSIGDLTNWVTRSLESQVKDFARYIHGQYISDSVPPPASQPDEPEGPGTALDPSMAL